MRVRELRVVIWNIVDSDVGLVGVNQCLCRVRYEIQGPAAACIKIAVKPASDECENPERYTSTRADETPLGG